MLTRRLYYFKIKIYRMTFFDVFFFPNIGFERQNVRPGLFVGENGGTPTRFPNGHRNPMRPPTALLEDKIPFDIRTLRFGNRDEMPPRHP